MDWARHGKCNKDIDYSEQDEMSRQHEALTIRTRHVEMTDDDVVLQHVADCLTAGVTNRITR